MRKKVIKALTTLGKSRYWLASASGVTRSNLYTWLEGKNTLSDEQVNKIRDVISGLGIQLKPWYAIITELSGVNVHYFSSYDEIVEYMRHDFLFDGEGLDDEEPLIESFEVVNGEPQVGGTVLVRVHAEKVNGVYFFSLDFKTNQETRGGRKL